MARVSDVEIDGVPAELRPLYRRFADAYGPFLNQVRIFAHRPPALRHIMGLVLELADEALVSRRHIEIAVVAVSKLNACEYCVAHHAPRLAAEGLGGETAERILDPDCPGLDDLDRLVRDYAVQVTRDARRVPDAMFAALRRHFSEPQIVELTLRIALCGFFNRFNDALGIEIEDDAIAGMPAPGDDPR
ncbi:MAG: carboxymuconolactone decarboxylase family protein [Alphaproteobacteria bacterium]